MRNFLFPIGLLFFCLAGFTQQRGPMYVAAKSGLSIREKGDANAKVLDKIPYGTKVTLLQTEEVKARLITEGMLGYWQKVTYNNKTGYILDTYLFPWPPPKSTVKEIKTYLAQVSMPHGGKLVIKSGAINNIAEGGWELNKQLFKNGAEIHEYGGYEYGGNTYILPGFNMEQGFLLVRMIPEFKDIFVEKDAFPSENKTYKKGENEYTLKIDKEVFSPEFIVTKNITLEYADGATYTFQMFMVGNQLVIVLEGGV